MGRRGVRAGHSKMDCSDIPTSGPGLQRYPDLRSTRLSPPLHPKASFSVALLLESASSTVFPIPLPQKYVSRQLLFFVLANSARVKVIYLGLREGDDKRVSPLYLPQNVSYKTPCPYLKISATNSPLPWLS